MRDPGLDDRLGNPVVVERFDQNLATPGELAAENPVRAVRFVERPPAVSNVATEMLRGMLVLETLDALTIGPLEEEADHHVVEASIDEIVDDRSQLWLSAELLEVAHPSETLMQAAKRIKLRHSTR